MDRLTSENQAFVTYAVVVGVRLVKVRADSKGYCRYDLLDSNGEATQALNRWIARDVPVNARDYAHTFNLVRGATLEARKRRATKQNAEPGRGSIQ